MFHRLNRIFVAAGLTAMIGGAGLIGAENTFAAGTKKRTARKDNEVQINVVAVGLTQETIDAARLEVERNAAVQKFLANKNYRFIGLEYIDSDKKGGGTDPSGFRATFYNYTDDKTVIAEADFAALGNPRAFESPLKPIPSPEEFEIAQKIIALDGNFAEAIRSQKLRSFAAMPPFTVSETGERLVNIGLEALGDSNINEVVSVSLLRSEVIRYADKAPETSGADASACGIPAGSGGSTGRGVAGNYQATITQNGTTLWEFNVTRPSASSGTMASGIELKNVRYKGKSVLKQGHVPVLNVLYTPSSCGPYRDWQYEEGAFVAPNTGAQNPAPGIRVLAPGQIATTALDTGNDAGDFRGVAIYRQNNETVMVSEMNAGWYRYIMEWRLADDGTIRPRYGFGATNNSCVCNVHVHHAYWRLDFDIVNPTNKIYQVERGRKYLTPILSEKVINRSYQTNRSLLIQNSTGDEAYMIVPNVNDGLTDVYGRSDFWVLRQKTVAGGTALQNEIDDGWSSIGGTCTTNADGTGSGSCININKFVTGESVDNQDLVVWYGSHFIHADGNNLLNPDRTGRTVLSGTHVVGPDIRPIRW